MRPDGATSRYHGTVPALNPIALLSLGQGMMRIDRLARSLDLEKPWASRNAARLDATTIAAWLARQRPHDDGAALAASGRPRPHDGGPG